MKYICVIGYKSDCGLGNKFFKLIGDIIILKGYYKANDEDIFIYYIQEINNEKTNVRKYPLETFFDLPFKIINQLDFVDIIKNYDYKILNRSDLKTDKPYIINCNNLAGVKNGFPILPEFIFKISNQISYESEFNKTLAYVYDKIDKDIWLKYREYIKLFKVNENLLQEILELKIDSNTLGVHIRKGDFETIKKRKIDSNKFIKNIKILMKENNFEKIFLCSDDNNLLINFKNIFNDKLFYIENKFEQRDELIAFKCIYSLSKCGHLIVTNLSSFSNLSWWFSENIIPVTYIRT